MEPINAEISKIVLEAYRSCKNIPDHWTLSEASLAELDPSGSNAYYLNRIFQLNKEAKEKGVLLMEWWRVNDCFNIKTNGTLLCEKCIQIYQFTNSIRFVKSQVEAFFDYYFKIDILHRSISKRIEAIPEEKIIEIYNDNDKKPDKNKLFNCRDISTALRVFDVNNDKKEDGFEIIEGKKERFKDFLRDDLGKRSEELKNRLKELYLRYGGKESTWEKGTKMKS